MWELKKTVRPWSRSSQDQRSHVTPAERIEPGHRLVEKDDLGVVQQRLRDPDALNHAFRELAQLEPALRADADAVQEVSDALAAINSSVAEQIARSSVSNSSAVR